MIIFTYLAELIFDPLVMYFTDNFNIVGVSGVNVCPVFKFGFHIPVIVLKIAFLYNSVELVGTNSIVVN